MKKLIGFFRPYILQPLTLSKQSGYDFQKFFLSFEDSLNYLFGHYKIGQGTEYCLLPNFYCPATLKFISQYCKVIFYKVNNDFSIDFESYFKQIEVYKPRVIINYALTGFRLKSEQRENLKLLTGEQTIIIEDYAHRFLLPGEIDLSGSNHFYIDSIRKQGPLLGSHLLNSQVKINTLRIQLVNFYKFKCYFAQLLKGSLNCKAYILRLPKLADWAEIIFNWQDDLIGRNLKPTRACFLSYFLSNHLDLVKLRDHKKQISIFYTQSLLRLNSSLIKVLEQGSIERSELNYYPLFVAPEYQAKLLAFLKSKNIFADRLWELSYSLPELNQHLYRSFIILPLTWLIRPKDVTYIVEQINEFIKQTKVQ